MVNKERIDLHQCYHVGIGEVKISDACIQPCRDWCRKVFQPSLWMWQIWRVGTVMIVQGLCTRWGHTFWIMSPIRPTIYDQGRRSFDSKNGLNYCYSGAISRAKMSSEETDTILSISKGFWKFVKQQNTDALSLHSPRESTVAGSAERWLCSSL